MSELYAVVKAPKHGRIGKMLSATLYSDESHAQTSLVSLVSTDAKRRYGAKWLENNYDQVHIDTGYAHLIAPKDEIFYRVLPVDGHEHFDYAYLNRSRNLYMLVESGENSILSSHSRLFVAPYLDIAQSELKWRVSRQALKDIGGYYQSKQNSDWAIDDDTMHGFVGCNPGIHYQIITIKKNTSLLP